MATATTKLSSFTHAGLPAAGATDSPAASGPSSEVRGKVMLCCHVAGTSVGPAVCGETAKQVAIRLRDEHVDWLPVCDGERRVVGAIGDRDLALKVCGEGLAASQVPVEELMSQNFVTCTGAATFREAEELMIRGRTSRLIVTDEEGKLFGVISLTDVLHYSDPLSAARVARAIKDPDFRVRSSRPALNRF